MIDKRTGKVYDIPLGETEDGVTPYESGAECFADGAELDDNERLALNFKLLFLLYLSFNAKFLA
ncbi:hypothetical protein [Psychrobacter sp. I-STPA10]|uniref:hypothetical protein n=1 Tax=Psychrobacter sp. I-STPA10 TaxID=2585769 RepID=UPI001E43E484|nr:hypothetical protein [Psychrobacter sp. I-STPA10]